MDDLSTLERFTVGAKGKGVYVQASTLGALEALLTFLQSNKVPVFDFGVGPVFSKTIRGHVLMTERAPEYACVLAFDVPIDPDAKALAAKEGLKIFTGRSLPLHNWYHANIPAPVIYHLFDAFQKYLAEVIEARKQAAMDTAVWPVRLSIIQAFAHRDPIILGCDITEGTLRVGTPVGVVRYDKATKVREIIKLGKMCVFRLKLPWCLCWSGSTSLEKEHKSVNLVKKREVGGGIAVKIERAPWETARLYGRQYVPSCSLRTKSWQAVSTIKTK
jgi:translation initiation factor 5B